MDAIPIFSQVKSLVQVISGDHKGAEATQKNFLKLCPVVSQGTSLVQALSGDEEGARETQVQFLKGMNGAVDSLPVVGHVKGTVHYICGDKEGGDNAMKAATRTTGVMAVGVGGFLVGGPVGATVGGMMGGLAMDDVITGADIIVNGKNAKPYGLVENVIQIIKDPNNAGNYVDLVGNVALDGITGYVAGQGLGKKITCKLEENKLQKMVGNAAAEQIMDAGESMTEIHSSSDIKNNKPHVLTVAEDLQTGKRYEGHNVQIRKVLKNNKKMCNGPTELQKRVPNAKAPLKRRVASCAEQQAYNDLYKDRVNVAPGEIRSVSVKMSKTLKKPVTIQRCDNCKVFSSAMGSVPTDHIDEITVPKRMNWSKVGVSTGVGCGVCALAHESKQ